MKKLNYFLKFLKKNQSVKTKTKSKVLQKILSWTITWIKISTKACFVLKRMLSKSGVHSCKISPKLIIPAYRYHFYQIHQKTSSCIRHLLMKWAISRTRVCIGKSNSQQRKFRTNRVAVTHSAHIWKSGQQFLIWTWRNKMTIRSPSSTTWRSMMSNKKKDLKTQLILET